jgi:hypothetical protein
MGQAGMRAVRDRFNWQTEQMKLLELYRRVLHPASISPSKASKRNTGAKKDPRQPVGVDW